MSFRDGARTAGGSLAVTLLVVVIIAVITALFFGLWALFAPLVSSTQREVNYNSQQYQDAQIAEAESLIDGILKSADEGQKEILTARFCTTYGRIIDPPTDLVIAASKFC
jgi:hypothetical protein